MRKLLTILALSLALALVSPALAQDATPEVPVPVIVVTEMPPALNVDTDGGDFNYVEAPAEPKPTREIPESVMLAIIFGISAFAIVAIILYARHKGLSTQQAFQQLPGIVTEYGYPAVWNYRYGQAMRTVDPADNLALKEEARFFGYRVTERPDGSVLLERDPAYTAPVPPAMG